jgi:hypothetical protein
MANVAGTDYGIVDVYDCNERIGGKLWACDYCDHLYIDVGNTVFSIESSFGTGLRVCRQCAVALARTLAEKAANNE